MTTTFPKGGLTSMSASLDEEYLTVTETASLFKVSQSTIWRWLNQGTITAYRIGHRGIRLKRTELTRFITPARKEREKGGGMTDIEKERERLSRPLTKKEQQKGLAALEAAQELKDQMLKRHGGKLFSDSTEIIRKMREERTRQLS